MKKYTIAWVPTEGEISPGEIYRSKWRSENKFYHFSTCAKIDGGLIYPTEGVNSNIGFPLDDAIKIRPVLYFNGEYFAEISKEAYLFLKPFGLGENDTRSEDNVKPYYMMTDVECAYKPGVDPEHWLEKCFYKIKGPCGHFH